MSNALCDGVQRTAVFLEHVTVHFAFPAPSTQVRPGIPWGSIDAFPSPAYWAYQVLARRAAGTSVRYRLGATLTEEVAACLLGGHGIPASIGLAAFNHVRQAGLLLQGRHEMASEADLREILSAPMKLNGKLVRYRFARQKARYLRSALERLASGPAPTATGRLLRDWLLPVQGIGFKTASWIARNWLDADDVAILDIHILRAGMLAGFFEEGLSVERDYLVLEQQFLAFARGLGVLPSELDALMWHEMASSPLTVKRLFRDRAAGAPGATPS
ncbi:8-oxoguanine DNA glycosylase [Variovorax gossypii]